MLLGNTTNLLHQSTATMSSLRTTSLNLFNRGLLNANRASLARPNAAIQPCRGMQSSARPDGSGYVSPLDAVPPSDETHKLFNDLLGGSRRALAKAITLGTCHCALNSVLALTCLPGFCVPYAIRLISD